MKDSQTTGFSAAFNLDYVTFTLTISIWVVLAIASVALIAWIIRKAYSHGGKDVKLTKITLNIAGQKLNFDVERNYLNLEIAHKILIELVTRKAAIPINENNDIISEIYDSWYTLFQTTREEIKLITGELLENPKSEALVEMATDVLNKGLRPHLTAYQGRFRRWYKLELAKESNAGKSPQQIQKAFPEYKELITSMKAVNVLLHEYARQLKGFIYGNTTFDENRMVE